MGLTLQTRYVISFREFELRCELRQPLAATVESKICLLRSFWSVLVSIARFKL